MPGNTYAIADLHGRLDILEAALAAIEADADQPGTVIFLGDYVDRGPDSKGIIDRLMAGPPEGWTWICLQGNHEAMMVACVRGLADMAWWIGNGGGWTLLSYGMDGRAPIDASVVPAEHLEWLDKLPLMFVDEHRVFVHAGVDPDVPLDAQLPEVLQWKIYRRGDDRGHGDRHVVHGHEQFADGPILRAGRTDLDTFAWRTGRIVVGVFDNDVPGGPSELIQVTSGPRKASGLLNVETESSDSQ